MLPGLMAALFAAQLLAVLAVWLLRRRLSPCVTVPLAVSFLGSALRRVSTAMLLMGYGAPWLMIDAIVAPTIITTALCAAALCALALYWDGSPWQRASRS